MYKREIVREIASHGINLDKSAEIYESIINLFKTALKENDSITLQGFGTLSVITLKPRNGVNPSSGAKMQIPESKKVKFQMSRKYKKELNNIS